MTDRRVRPSGLYLHLDRRRPVVTGEMSAFFEISPEAWEALANYRRRFPKIVELWASESIEGEAIAWLKLREGARRWPPAPITPLAELTSDTSTLVYRLNFWTGEWKMIHDSK